MTPLALVAVFGAGIASFLAPCALPLVPAYLGMIGSAATGGATGSRSVPRATLAFVAGFASVFVFLGAVAGALGGSASAMAPILRWIGGGLVVVFGFALLGLPVGLRDRRPLQRLARAGPFGIGVAFGSAWTPCVGPLLGAALVLAATEGGAVNGGVLLAAYALGLGLPFIALSLSITAAPAVLDRFRRSAHRIEPVAGVILVTLGVLLVSGLYDRLIAVLGSASS